MLRTSLKCQGRGLTANLTSPDLFLLTCPLVTNLEKSKVILIHQLSDFRISGHKFFKNIKDAKWRLIQTAAKIIQRPVFLTQGMTYGKQTQSSAEPTELWPTDWAIDQASIKQDVNCLLQAIHQPQEQEQLLKLEEQAFPKTPQHNMPGTFEPDSPAKQQSLWPLPLQQSTLTLAKPTAQLARANFKYLDSLVLKSSHSKATPPSRPQAHKLTSVPPSVLNFTSANVDQIVAWAVLTALAEAQKLQTISDSQKPLCCALAPVAEAGAMTTRTIMLLVAW